MTKDEIEAALRLADKWLQISGVVVAIGAVGAAFFGVRHWLLDKQLSPMIAAEELARKETIARLSNDAETARREIAVAQARAAEANQKAETEALARAKIEEKLMPRSLTKEQMQTITKRVAAYGGQAVNLFAYSGSSEIVGITNQIDAALQEAHWRVSASIGQESGRAVTGIAVELAEGKAPADVHAAVALVAALTHERLAVSGPAPLNSFPTMATGNLDNSAKIRVTIGPKL